MALTRSVGRVSIRVLPDSTGFRRDLKKTLDRIERSVRVNIPVELSVDRATLQKLKEQIENLRIALRPDIDLTLSPEQIAKMKERIERMRPKVDVDLNTKSTSARIAALTRTRKLDILVNVRDEALTRLSARLKGIAGLNVLGDSFREGSEFFNNIDRNAIRLGKLFTTVGAIASLVGTLAANSLVIVSQLAAVGSLAFLAPGFLTGFGIGIGVLVTAFKDMGKVLGDLKPKFQDLQKTVSSNFWDMAERPIRNLISSLLPTLSNLLGKTAIEMGKLFGSIATQLRETITPAQLRLMFGRMNDAINQSRILVKPLIEAFARLGEVGTRYFGRFVEFLGTLANRFNSFTKRVVDSGQIFDWIENGIQSLKDLAAIVGSVTKILGGLSDAAQAAGAGGLTSLRKGLEGVAKAVNGPEFQRSLSLFFVALGQATQQISDGVKGLGPAFRSVLPTINTALVQIGGVVKTILGYFGQILSNPNFQKGLGQFIDGIAKGFEALKPAIGPIGDSLGALGRILGKVAEAVGKLLGSGLQALSPVFDSLQEAVEPLIKPLGDFLVKAIQDLAPVFKQLIDAMKPLIPVLIDDLLPAFTQLIKEGIVPALIELMPSIVTIIKDGVVPAIKAFASIVKDLTPRLQELGKILGPVLDLLGKVAGFLSIALRVGDFFRILGDGTTNLADKVKELNKLIPDFMKGFVEDSAKNLQGLIQPFVDFGVQAYASFTQTTMLLRQVWDEFWTAVGQVVQIAFNNVMKFVGDSLMNIGTFFVQAGGNISNTWNSMWSFLTQSVTNAGNSITAFVSNSLRSVSQFFANAGSTISSNWNNLWGSVGATAQRWMANLVQVISNGLSNAGAWFQRFGSSAISFVGNAFSGIVNWAQQGISGFVNTISSGINNAVAWFQSLPGRVIGAINYLAGSLFSSGQNLIGSFINGIASMIGQVANVASSIASTARAFFPFSPAKRGPFSGTGYTTFSGKALVKDFAQGMLSNLNLVDAASSKLMDAANPNNAMSLTQSIDPNITVDQRQVKITNINPVAQPESESITQAAAVFRLGAVNR